MIRTTTYYEQRASAIIHSICYATVATVDKLGTPWNSPVSAVFDRDFNVYWFSDRQSQHSRNIRSNGRAFIVIYNSTWPEGTGAQGLYLQSQAAEVTDLTEIKKACDMKDRGRKDYARFTGCHVRRVYKASPYRMWMNEVKTQNGRFIKDYRVEIKLPGRS